MARILIAGKGGYGDMFPMFSIAKKLQQSGHIVEIAAERHHADAARSIDIPLIPINLIQDHKNKNDAAPSFAEFRELIQTLTPANLEKEYEILLTAAQNADLIIGNHLAYTASIVRKKLKKPWVYCSPSPLAFPSRFDPPSFPYLHTLQRISSQLGIPAGYYVDFAKKMSKIVMASTLRQQRRLGIHDERNPRFEGIYSDQLNLLLTSPQLIREQADWPTNTFITGFTWFEPTFLLADEKSRNLQEFTKKGEAPIVFAPSGSARGNPLKFFAECREACEKNNLRGILVAATRFHHLLPSSETIHVSSYIPYSQLLHRAKIIVHSGGIGALGWGLRHGIPSIMTPLSLDQYDNAYRAQALNFGSVLSKRHFCAKRIADEIRRMENDESLPSRMEYCRTLITKEDGSDIACTKINELLKQLA